MLYEIFKFVPQAKIVFISSRESRWRYFPGLVLELENYLDV